MINIYDIIERLSHMSGVVCELHQPFSNRIHITVTRLVPNLRNTAGIRGYGVIYVSRFMSAQCKINLIYN